MQRSCFIDTWVILQVFKRDADLLENWLVSRETLLHDGNLGDTIGQVEDLIRKHEDFEKTVQAQEDKFNALKRVTMVGSQFLCVCVCVNYCYHVALLQCKVGLCAGLCLCMYLYKGLPSECGKAHFSCSVSSHIHTYLLTPWCRVLEKLTGLQLVKKFPAFYGTQRFITALTSVSHLSLSWASPIQSIYPHPTSWRSILILSTHLCLGLPSGLFPSGFLTKTL